MLRKDFYWGASTAATQIEGGAHEDGKGVSVWDVIPTIDDAVFHGETADVACDHYHKFREDVALMKELGLKAYRFSIAWTRIIPMGRGEVNQKGIKFYNDLIDELKANGIEPFITLLHSDLPYELYKKGGFLNREIVDAFAEYTKVVAENFAGKVKYFMTINEPACTLNSFFHNQKLSMKEKNNMIHNLLLCHGVATKILHEYGAQVSIVPNCAPPVPKTNSPEDIEAARKEFFRFERDRIWNMGYFSDPVVLGDYPKEYYEVYTKDEQADILPGDMKIISEPIDYYCTNIYNGDYYISSDGKGGWIKEEFNGAKARTCMNWPVEPRGLYWGAKFLCGRYKLPFYITENGCAVTDVITKDKKIHDGARVEFLNQYIAWYLKAAEEGVDIRGYFCWSFMDNYEWSLSYSRRFGLVYVDYDTFERYPKDSFYFYQQVIKENGENLDKV